MGKTDELGFSQKSITYLGVTSGIVFVALMIIFAPELAPIVLAASLLLYLACFGPGYYDGK